MAIPAVPRGQMLLAVVLRVEDVMCSDTTWTRVLNGFGSGPGDTIRVNVYARIADGTQGDTVAFMSLVEQELQGCLVSLENALVASVIEVTEELAFFADTTPNAPAAASSHTQNALLCVWSAADEIDFVPPPGTTQLDT